jgi:hypothetical protein
MQFHEFMRIARVTIPATEFTPAVWIQAPFKRHAGPGPVQQTLAADFEVLHPPFCFQYFAFRRKFRDSDKARRGRIAEQHDSIFAFYSPLSSGIACGVLHYFQFNWSASPPRFSGLADSFCAKQKN